MFRESDGEKAERAVGKEDARLYVLGAYPTPNYLAVMAQIK